MTNASSLKFISIVLVKTSHPGNVGAVARAMKTMGIYNLRLVSPLKHDLHQQPEAVAFASGATDVLENAQIFDSLPEALHDVGAAWALSARTRDLGPALVSPAQAAQDAQHLIHYNMARLENEPQSNHSNVASNPQQLAFVLGAERTGLTNDELLCCNRQVFIPSNPEYSSLNLAQATQIICYALRCQFQEIPEEISQATLQSAPLASLQALDHLKNHWLQAMTEVGFLNSDQPGRLPQRLARLLARAQLEAQEVDFLRGFLSDVVRVAQNRLYPHEQNKKDAP